MPLTPLSTSSRFPAELSCPGAQLPHRTLLRLPPSVQSEAEHKLGLFLEPSILFITSYDLLCGCLMGTSFTRELLGAELWGRLAHYVLGAVGGASCSAALDSSQKPNEDAPVPTGHWRLRKRQDSSRKDYWGHRRRGSWGSLL